MTEIEELQEEIEYLKSQVQDKNSEIYDLESDLKEKERESYKYECEKDELQEKLDDIEENKDNALRLLTNLYLSKTHQTEWDKEINDLLMSIPDLLPRYVTPYFIKLL